MMLIYDYFITIFLFCNLYHANIKKRNPRDEDQNIQNQKLINSQFTDRSRIPDSGFINLVVDSPEEDSILSDKESKLDLTLKNSKKSYISNILDEIVKSEFKELESNFNNNKRDEIIKAENSICSQIKTFQCFFEQVYLLCPQICNKSNKPDTEELLMKNETKETSNINTWHQNNYPLKIDYPIHLYTPLYNTSYKENETVQNPKNENNKIFTNSEFKNDQDIMKDNQSLYFHYEDETQRKQKLLLNVKNQNISQTNDSFITTNQTPNQQLDSNYKIYMPFIVSELPSPIFQTEESQKNLNNQINYTNTLSNVPLTNNLTQYPQIITNDQSNAPIYSPKIETTTKYKPEYQINSNYQTYVPTPQFQPTTTLAKDYQINPNYNKYMPIFTDQFPSTQSQNQDPMIKNYDQSYITPQLALTQIHALSDKNDDNSTGNFVSNIPLESSELQNSNLNNSLTLSPKITQLNTTLSSYIPYSTYSPSNTYEYILLDVCKDIEIVHCITNETVLLKCPSKCQGCEKWNPWTNCDKKCNGKSYRSRICIDPVLGSKTESESKHCNTEKCKIECSKFTNWSECSKPCGSGVKTRSRMCLLPNDESKKYYEHSVCNSQPCPLNISLSNISLECYINFDNFRDDVNIIYDESPKHNDISIENIELVNGNFTCGFGAYFGKVSSIAVFKDNPFKNFLDETVSISLWILPKSFYTTTIQTIINFTSLQNGYGAHILQLKQKKLLWSIYNANGQILFAIQSKKTLTDIWAHVTLVYDNKSHPILYINGKPSGLIIPVETNQNNSILQYDSLTIGNTRELNEPYNGYIDELYVISNSLDISEIFSIANTCSLRKSFGCHSPLMGFCKNCPECNVYEDNIKTRYTTPNNKRDTPLIS